MGANPVGNAGQSWHALQPHPDSADADAASAQHASNSPHAQVQDSAHDDNAPSPAADHASPSTDNAPQNPASGQSGSTHIVDHSKPADANKPSDPNAPTDSGNKVDNQGSQDGQTRTGQASGNSQGGQDSVTLKPQGAQGSTDPQANSTGGADGGKLDGKNSGWGDGIGGGQNKGGFDYGNNTRIGDANGYGSQRSDGQGLLDVVGNTLNSVGNTLGSLLSRGAADNVYGGSNLSFVNTYSAQDSFYDGGAGQAHSEGPLSFIGDAVGGAVHDIGEAAASLLDGRSGNRVDPSNLSDKSFNDWAGSKSDANASARVGNGQAGKNAAETNNSAQSRGADPNANVAHADEEESIGRSAGSDEEAEASLLGTDKSTPSTNLRFADVEEEAAPIALGEEETELDALGRNAVSTAATSVDGKLADALKQMAEPAQEDGPSLLNLQLKPGQAQTEAAKGGSVAEDAQAEEAASLRQSFAARSLDIAATLRNAGLGENALRSSTSEQMQNQPMQNANYVGEGRQVAPDANKSLVGTVERVDAVAANSNIEHDEMNQNEHLDNQQILLQQFTPALVGISALISSAIGGTTMLVSPGGSAAPFLLGVSALLFGMGAWRSAGTARAQLAQDKTWAEMLGDPGARLSLVAAGAHGIGALGSVGLSLLALV
ncbi:MAG: hypothetical protein IJI03_15540 [Rudaea sp.]|nr:hypothetical protein [Rudaea sp.]